MFRVFVFRALGFKGFGGFIRYRLGFRVLGFEGFGLEALEL